MLVCMRTTIDIPDALLARVKDRMQRQSITFRAMVISSLEKTLGEDTKPFVLEDASVGKTSDRSVSSNEINQWIDSNRESEFQA